MCIYQNQGAVCEGDIKWADFQTLKWLIDDVDDDRITLITNILHVREGREVGIGMVAFPTDYFVWAVTYLPCSFSIKMLSDF